MHFTTARRFAVLILLGAATACGGGSDGNTLPTQKSVASVPVTPPNATLSVGSIAQFTATPLDNAGNSLSGRAISWSTSNVSVASVSSSGTVTAVAAGAPVTITATSEGVQGTATVTVLANVATVSVSSTVQSLQSGTTTQLTVTARDASNNALSGRTTVWSTNSAAVATVSASGLVSAVGAGSVIITATVEGKVGTVALAVTPAPVASVTVSLAPASVSAGATTNATAVLRDAAGTILTGRTITWSSSNTAVATFDVTGIAAALAPGATTITGTSEGQRGTATLTVTAGAAGIAPIATAPGVASGAIAASNIGAAGGSVISSDGRVTVLIPAGALSSTVSISIQPITNTAPGGVGLGYQLLPEGQTFAVPVQLTFRYTATELGATNADVLSAAFQDDGGYWQPLSTGTFDAASSALTVSTTHFSRWVSVQGFQLNPGRAVVLTNGTLNLTAIYCARTPRVAGAAQRLAACSSAGVSVTTWSVNSIPNGNGASVGSVFGNSLTAIYTAPAQSPTANPVAISATVDAPLRTGETGSRQVVSNVTVADQAWTGTTNFDEVSFANSTTVRWVLSSMVNGVATYRPTGTIVIAPRDCSYNPASHSIDTGSLIVDFNASPATYHGIAAQGWPATVTCAGVPLTSAAFATWFGRGDLAEANGVVTIVGGFPTIVGNNLLFRWRFTATN